MLQEPVIASGIFVVLRILEQVFKKWRESRVTRNTSNASYKNEKCVSDIGKVNECDCERRRKEFTAEIRIIESKFNGAIEKFRSDSRHDTEKIERDLKNELDKEVNRLIQTTRDFRDIVNDTFVDIYNHGRSIGYNLHEIKGTLEEMNRLKSEKSNISS